VTEAAPQLSIDTPTGIAVTLPLAGAGARAYAFVVDWHIRIVLALAWYGAGTFLYHYLHNGEISLARPLGTNVGWLGTVVAPALALYFLYHPLLELLLRGSTPGKRLAGVRVVARDGSVAGAGALLVRNVFRLIDSLPLGYGLGLLLVALTREHVRCGDMAAGTLLIYESASPALAMTPAPCGSLDVATAELVAELLARWPGLTLAARASLARQLLKRCGRPAEEIAPLDDAALRRILIEVTRAAGANV